MSTESSADEQSSSSEEDEEEFGDFDEFVGAPSLHSPDSGRSDPRYANAPRRNPSPYYYGDLFRSTNAPATPAAPPATSTGRAPRYRKSASLDAPHVAARPALPKRFSVAEDGFRELERSSSSSGEGAWMPPRRGAREAAGCACEGEPRDRRPPRSVFYVPAPLPRWPREMTARQVYETAFDCKIAKSDDDLDDLDRVGNHPLLRTADRAPSPRAGPAPAPTPARSPAARQVALKTDSVRRSKIPTIRQKRESEEAALCSRLERTRLQASPPPPPPSPPSTAPLPAKFQQRDAAMSSIRSAPELPRPAPRPRIKDLRLPVKSLRRDAPPADTSRDSDPDRPQSKDGIFLEIKGRPTSDSDMPKSNRFRGQQGVGPVKEFSGGPAGKYCSTDSLTSGSSGSLDSLGSSARSDSRRSSSLSSHSSDDHPAVLHVLSPISDKSQEPASDTSDHNKVSPERPAPAPHTAAEPPTRPRRRALQNRNLLNLTFRRSATGDAEIQGSDSGISIHSREGVDSRNAFISFKNANNTEEERKDEGVELSDLPFDMPKLRRRRAEAETADLRSLPFDMPKLKRKLRGQSLQLTNDFGSAISNASSSQSVQDLNQGE